MRLPPRFIAKTAAIAIVGALGMVSEGWSVSAPIHEPASRFLAVAADRLVRLLGLPTYLDGTTVYSLGFSVRVVPECNGLIIIATILTGVALLRIPRRQRLICALVLLLSVWVLNLLRIVTVLAIGTRSAANAEVAHRVVFPAIWTGLFGCLWFFWLKSEFSEGGSKGNRP
jgi:exosortase/archaeosortase family protein